MQQDKLKGIVKAIEADKVKQEHEQEQSKQL